MKMREPTELDERAVAAAVIAHDNEENAQRGEPKAWTEIPTDDTSGEWAERLFCMEEGIRAYLAAIPQPQAGEPVDREDDGFISPADYADIFRSGAASPLPASQARVTEAMVKAAIDAWENVYEAELYLGSPTYTDNKEVAMRAALTAAIGAGGQAVETCRECDGTGFKDKNGARLTLARTPCGACAGNGYVPVLSTTAATADGWRFQVHDSDGRTWLELRTPNGATALLSCQTRHAEGETIAAQVLHQFTLTLPAAPTATGGR